MNNLKINLVVIQPVGYVHSLVFLDTARYFRHQLRRGGHEVVISKNRVRADCVNVVFGAHLGLPSEWGDRYCIVLVNLEQLGAGGAVLPAVYLQHLQRYPVIDYRADNRQAYRQSGAAGEVPLVEFHHAPYLAAAQGVTLRDRPIDLLFIGSMNERRQRVIERIRSTGVDVAVFDQPMYGPERDEFVQQAKAVINIAFYDTGTFEQVRAFGVLSLGTPLVSIRSDTVPDVHQNTVLWVEDAELETYFKQNFKSSAWYDQAEEALLRWATTDGFENFRAVEARCIGAWRAFAKATAPTVWRPQKLNLGSGKDYMPGWLNVDILDRAEPDLVLDLSQPLELPLSATCRDGIEVQLGESAFELVYANNVLEHVGDLPTLMTNALKLLKEGGVFLIEVPYERAQTAWQDPTHVRAMNEKSWLYYTDWFWYLGWFSHRFTVQAFAWLDAQLVECDQSRAAFMRVELLKVETTPQERVRARTLRADFGVIPADEMVELPQ